MEGVIDDPEQMGIIPRAATAIFQRLADGEFVDSNGWGLSRAV
jgi:hypothetical protein